jgi:hypothetical protein
MHQNKIRRHLEEPEEKSQLRKEDVTVQANFSDPHWDRQDSLPNGHRDFLPWGYCESAPSQPYLRFCNEGEEVDLAGQPLNFGSATLTFKQKEHVQREPDSHGEPSFPEFLF